MSGDILNLGLSSQEDAITNLLREEIKNDDWRPGWPDKVGELHPQDDEPGFRGYPAATQPERVIRSAGSLGVVVHRPDTLN